MPPLLADRVASLPKSSDWRGIRLPQLMKNCTTGKPVQVLQVAKTFCWRKRENISVVRYVLPRKTSISLYIDRNSRKANPYIFFRRLPHMARKASNNATALSGRIDIRNTTPSKKIFVRKILCAYFYLFLLARTEQPFKQCQLS